MNTHKYKTGDKVVALNNSTNTGSQPRKKGEIYTVTSVSYCVKCGTQLLNINNNKAKNPLSIVRCVCNSIQHNRGLAWTGAPNFVPLNAKGLEQVVATEDYEIAVVIRDSINSLVV